MKVPPPGEPYVHRSIRDISAYSILVTIIRKEVFMFIRPYLVSSIWYIFCNIPGISQLFFENVSQTLCTISLLMEHEKSRRTRWFTIIIRGVRNLLRLRRMIWIYKTIRSSFIICPSCIEGSYSVLLLRVVRLLRSQRLVDSSVGLKMSK